MAEAAVTAPVTTPNGPAVAACSASSSRRGRPTAIVARPRILGRWSLPSRHHGRDGRTVTCHARDAGIAAGSAGQDDRIVQLSIATRLPESSGRTRRFSLLSRWRSSFPSPRDHGGIILGIWGMLLGGRHVQAGLRGGRALGHHHALQILFSCPSATRPAGWPAPTRRLRPMLESVVHRAFWAPSTCSGSGGA